MKYKHIFSAFVISICFCFTNYAWSFVVTFDDAGIDGVYTDVGGSGIDVSCVSINNGFTYLSSEDLLSGVFDYAYAGEYDYDSLNGIVDSGVWMMDDHLPGGIQSCYIEFSDDVHFQEIWFSQAGNEFPVQGDVAYVTAYSSNAAGELDLAYKASVNFKSPDDFNQWFSISPPPGFEDVLVRELLLTFSNINYGVWDHLHFAPEPATIILLGLGGLALRRRKSA